MSLEERKSITRAVTYGLYEEALGVSIVDGRGKINENHIRLLAKYRRYPDVVESLNKAKNALVSEGDSQRARRYLRQGKNLEALHYLLKAVSRSEKAEDYHLLGLLLIKLHRDKDAVTSFEKAVEKRGNVTDHFFLGDAYARLGEYEKALGCFAKTLRMRGAAADFQSIGRIYFELGRYTEAYSMLKRAFQLDETTDYHLLKRCRARATKHRLKAFFFKKIRWAPRRNLAAGAARTFESNK